MAKTQENRAIAIETPLGKDVLLLQSMSGSEKLGQMFQFQLELLSEKNDITFADIVGHNVTIRLNLSNGEIRYFNGYVSGFVQTEDQGDLAHYQATVVPWMWFLTRTADCRIFQGKTVPEIIKEVFKEHGFTDIKDALTEKYRTWDYCAQYRETDYDFVNRLMEQEGIYYFFEHEEEKHSIVLADSINAHESYPGYDQIRYRPTYGALSTSEYIWDWLIASNIQPGMYKLNDFDYRNVKADILAVAKGPDVDSQTAAGSAVSELEIFDYPGEYVDEKTVSAHQDGERYARVRIQELQAQKFVCRARSDARGVAAGYLFELADHRRGDQNREYLVTSANYLMTTEPYEAKHEQKKSEPEEQRPVFECELTAISSDQPYRPPRVTALPMIRGPQTATVVGPEGEEIFTDKYGRVKVQFRWDRYGKSDENSSCWVRVSQSWAGGKSREDAPQPHWGSMHIPHIGDEVIVEFLEGDPDHPIITGRVYNADNVPPMDLPENKHKSIFRDNYGNELVFDATPGDEHIRLYSPNHKSGFVLGKNEGESRWTESNRAEWAIGDKFEVVAGSKGEISAGSVYDVKAGLVANATLGSEVNFLLGGSHSVDLGYRWNYSLFPDIRHAESDALTSAKQDQIIAAGDQLCLIGGAKGGGFRSIINAFPESLTLSVGNDTKYLDKHGNETDKPTGGMLYQPKPGKWWLIGGGLGFLALTLANTLVSVTDIDSDERPGLITTNAASLAFTIAMNIAIWLQVRDSTIEPVKHKEPAAEIKMKKDGDVTIKTSKDFDVESTKQIRLCSTENDIRLDAPAGFIFAKGGFKHKNFVVLA